MSRSLNPQLPAYPPSCLGWNVKTLQNFARAFQGLLNYLVKHFMQLAIMQIFAHVTLAVPFDEIDFPYRWLSDMRHLNFVLFFRFFMFDKLLKTYMRRT